MYMVWFGGGRGGELAYATVSLFKTNIPCDGSPEDMVKVFTLGGILPYNNVTFYTPIGGF